jgi:hypothetical protein
MAHAPERVHAIRRDVGCQMRTLSDLEAQVTDPFTGRLRQIRRWLVDAERLFVGGLSKPRTAESEEAWLSNTEIVVRGSARLLSSLRADMAKHDPKTKSTGRRPIGSPCQMSLENPSPLEALLISREVLWMRVSNPHNSIISPDGEFRILS